MSYQATCKGGSIYARTRKDAEAAIEALREYCCIDSEIRDSDSSGATVVDVLSDYISYDIEDFLPVAEYAAEGSEICFIGEDDSIWTLRLANGKVAESDGEPIWNGEEKTILLFNHIYTLLYEDKIPESFALIEACEKWMKENKEFLNLLVSERRDMFTSDRELNALALALNLEPIC